MRPTAPRVWPRARLIYLCLGTLSLSMVCTTRAQAIDLRDLPDYIRAQLSPIHIDWQQMHPLPLPAPPPLQTTPTPTPQGQQPVEGTVHIGGKAPQLDGLGTISIGRSTALDKALPTINVAGMGAGALCLDTIMQRHLTPEQFIAWADENTIQTEAITAAMTYSGIAWPELAPESMPLAAALSHRLGDDLQAIAGTPVIARLLLTTYFGINGNADAALRIFSTITDEQIASHDVGQLNCVTSHLCRTAPVACMDMLDRYAKVPQRGRSLTIVYRVACRKAGSPELIRERMIPFTIAALEQMPPLDYWDRALSALVWARQELGEHETAIAEAGSWLAEVEQLGVKPAAEAFCSLQMDLSDSHVATGRIDEAIAMLRQVIESDVDAWIRSGAEARLARIAMAHPEEAAGITLPEPQVKGRFPRDIRLALAPEAAITMVVHIQGTPTLQLEKAEWAVEGLQLAPVTIGEMRGGTYYEFSVTIQAPKTAGTYRGTLNITTNDPRQTLYAVPIHLEVGDKTGRGDIPPEVTPAR